MYIYIYVTIRAANDRGRYYTHTFIAALAMYMLTTVYYVRALELVGNDTKLTRHRSVGPWLAGRPNGRMRREKAHLNSSSSSSQRFFSFAQAATSFYGCEKCLIGDLRRHSPFELVMQTRRALREKERKRKGKNTGEDKAKLAASYLLAT